MIDYLPIGPTPSGEECAQVGQENYYTQAMSECRRFIELIRKALGPE